MPATTQEQETPSPSPKNRDGLNTELKRRLVDHLDMLKRPNDIVRVTQITNRHFRVNTLTPSHDVESVLPVYKFAKSQFLFVEDRLGELVIVDQTRT